MWLIWNNLGHRSSINALLCTVGLALIAVIISHEMLANIYSQNRGTRDSFNPSQQCISSISVRGHRIFSITSIWCLGRQTTLSQFVHPVAEIMLKGRNTSILTTLYNTYISLLISSGTILTIILLRIISPILRQHSPIPIIYSFLTWRPTLVVTFSILSYKIFQSNSDILSALTLQPWLSAFLFLVTFKFLKVFVHTFSFYFLTRPAQQPVNPSLHPTDVTVIVPSVGEFDDEFVECIESIIANNPRRVIVCTVGLAKLNKAKKVTSEICSQRSYARITVLSVTEPNKRAQFLRAVSAVQTKIIAYADDHVFWPRTFLKSALAPFEDQRVGIVGTIKRVRRDRSGGFWRSFMNYIACLYLERHNFECTASYNIDGGVFVISGRTALTRTCIVHHVDFRRRFMNETWLWGSVGPLKVDDDNFITRWMVQHGWKTVFHNSPDAIVETTLGTTGGLQKFRGQLIRWVRTTWRSNSTSLFSERTCWTVHPWTTFAMFISSFFNIALIYDPLLILALYRSGYSYHMYILVFALLISKLIKPIEHLRREPQCIKVMLPLGLMFGYVHSLFKIWAFFTAGNIEWSGRKGIK